MATCLTTISEAQQLTEISSDITYRLSIDQNNNSLFTLTNDLDQSVFFNIRFIGSYSNFSASLTIYNINTLRVFGTLNLNQQSVNTSFSITAGEYYICIRPIIGEYELDFKSTFISYNKVATFNTRSYFGYSSDSILETSRAPGLCTRRLFYTIIDGKLPEGLTMQDNGLITGTLPMLDCDEENKDLPSSSSWYHKISDSEYVTSWGRAYRFRVHLTLFDDRTKEDIHWFYISILNDFSKNFALVDKYEVLEDDHIATFEEKIKLNTLNLCPPTSCGTASSNNIVLDLPPELLPEAQNNINGNNSNSQSAQNNINGTNSNSQSAENNSNSEQVDDPLSEMSPSNRLYMDVEKYQVDDQDEPILYNFDTGYEEREDEYIEMFLLEDKYVKNNQFSYMGNDLFKYYIDKFEENNDLVIQLKDSYMFNVYLKENNFSNEYINEDVFDRLDYEDIELSIIELEKEYYIQLKNKIKKEYDESTDAQERIDQIQLELYNKLPWSPYAMVGFTSTFNLIQVK